jgi:hypothetical protein
MRNDTVRGIRSCGLAAVIILSGGACIDSAAKAIGPTPPGSPAVAMVTKEVTIDFSTFGQGKLFDPDFYRSEGIVFPAEFCGSAGCDPLFVGFIQGDAALVGDPRRGPLTAKFTRPISSLSLSVAPSFQGTATYTLKLFSASGALVASTSVTVTQDDGEPANSVSGYFEISATSPGKAVKSFSLDNVFVRASGPHAGVIPYGVSSITYTY